MLEIITTVYTYFASPLGMVELIGSLFNLICVYLAAKHNQWTWFFGVLGVLMFGFLFFEYKLYSDAALQILFFLPMQIWGFLKWKELTEQSNTKSFTMSLDMEYILLITIGVLFLTLTTGYVMLSYTDASFPYADAWTTWMSVFAQILMIRKYWQSWLMWVIMDIGAIYIYFSKELFVVSGLYVIFLIIATIGLYKWYNDWENQSKIKANDGATK